MSRIEISSADVIARKYKARIKLHGDRAVVYRGEERLGSMIIKRDKVAKWELQLILCASANYLPSMN